MSASDLTKAVRMAKETERTAWQRYEEACREDAPLALLQVRRLAWREAQRATYAALDAYFLGMEHAR